MHATNTSQVVQNLSQSFHNELKKYPYNRNNAKGSFIYKLQVEFMYAMDSITRGGPVEVESGISQIKRLIVELRSKKI